MITGCSTGFGRLLAQTLLDRGESVAATARNVDQLADIGPDAGGKIARLAMDVTRGSQIRTAIQAAYEQFGRIDVLVNNAGYGYFSTHEEGDIDEIRRMFETNVMGLIRVTQAVLPEMRVRKSGVIVNVSSIAGRVAFPRSSFYSASKFAVEAISESLHHEVRPLGIRVIVIEPGSFDTDFGPRSAVRSPGLTDPSAPYAAQAATWSAVAAKLLPRRQDPMVVVERIIECVNRNEGFLRVPVGTDAISLVQVRESSGEAEFIRTMNARYNAP